MSDEPTRQHHSIVRVIDPVTGATVALEIVTQDGRTFFVAADPFWGGGLRVGTFPVAQSRPWVRQPLADLAVTL